MQRARAHRARAAIGGIAPALRGGAISVFAAALLAGCSAATEDDDAPGAQVIAGSAAPGEPPPEPAPEPVMSDDVVLQACAFEPPSGTRPRCGFLPVPQKRGEFRFGDIPLHFAIFPATARQARVADPVVYLEGGPGGSALARAAELHALITPAIGAGRDLVLVDQRGTGLSVAAAPLSCQDDVTNAVLEGSRAPIVTGLRACGDRLRALGIDVASHNSKENAADFEQLRVALGYPAWNLLGISYGTFLGQVIVRDHGAGVRSVVLDSTLPVGDDYTRRPGNLQRALDELFAACAADEDCAGWYPQLEDTFYTLLRRLETEPVDAELRQPGNIAADSVPVVPALLLSGTFSALYTPKLLALVPRMIAELAAGDSELFAMLFNAVVEHQSSISDGMHYAVTCYDRVAFTTAPDIEAAIAEHSALAPLFTGFLGADARLACEGFGAGRATADEGEPVVSALPTLVLGGRFDPVTAPQGGRDVAAALEHGRFVEFPWQSHGVIRSPCAQALIERFLHDPAAEPVADCAERDPALSFVAPDGELPQLARIMAQMVPAPPP